MKLHLGCGKKDFGKGWIHIDGADFPHVKYNDVKKLPFEDNSVDVIYACHLLEYFDREEVKEVLKEWNRVMKEGAILRLAVPNFTKMVELYVRKGIELKSFLGMLYGKWKMNDKTIYHKTTYDPHDLADLLRSTGFKDVKLYDWRKTEHSNFDDYSQAYFPHMDKEHGTLMSLNVECIK